MAKKKIKHCNFMLRKLGMAQGEVLCAHSAVLKKADPLDALDNAVQDLSYVYEEIEIKQVKSVIGKIEELKKKLLKTPTLISSERKVLEKKLIDIADAIDGITPSGCEDRK